MTRFPGLEAKILRTLEEEGEMRPPAGRIGQEWFWQAASQLQARGLCVADQVAGVVRRNTPAVSWGSSPIEPWLDRHPEIREELEGGEA